MTGNNGSRKRRRVTFEDDAEAPSGRGRADGRDTEQDYGLSSGRGDEVLGYVARDDDVSTRRVGEATGGGVRAYRRDHTGPVETPQQQPPSAGQGRQEGPDHIVPPHIGVLAMQEVVSLWILCELGVLPINVFRTIYSGHQ